MTSAPVTGFKSDKPTLASVSAAMFDDLIMKDIPKSVFIIGVCGGSASGKTTVCCEIIKRLKGKSIEILSQDSFYKSLTDDQKAKAALSQYDFDHPDAFDYDIFDKTVATLKRGGIASVPVYDFTTHSRLDQRVIKKADVIIVEGILIFYSKALRDMMDLKIFVDTEDDVRLTRRIRRDIQERGRETIGVLDQWERYVKPSFDNYIMPSKKYADVIIPRGGDNLVAIDLMVQHIKLRLVACGDPTQQFKGRHSYEI